MSPSSSSQSNPSKTATNSVQDVSKDSFKTRRPFEGAAGASFFSIPALESQYPQIQKFPFSIKILLENLLRNEDGVAVTKKDVESILRWDPKAEPSQEIQFMPARVVLQDFTGVPCVADLAAMRDAIQKLGGDAARINPLQPADLVIDHSVQVDYFGSSDAMTKNAEVEFSRNRERYEFLRWGQEAFRNFKVVPPDTGIVHQVNIEYLAPVAMKASSGDKTSLVYHDTVVGTDSHTTMVNGLGVLGWGVGGIEAEAAMLGQPITMLIPQVVGFRLVGHLPEGTTATDLVLTVTQMLRKKGVVGKFVEFFGPGVASLPLADRATIANMAPEYGATCGLFPVDAKTIDYLRLTGRSDEQLKLVESFYRAQGMFWGEKGNIGEQVQYTDTLELDLSSVKPSLAGPARPQDRVTLGDVPAGFASSFKTTPKEARVKDTERGSDYTMKHGDVVIAAITSCTNTSNPYVLIGAGLLARNAVKKGLKAKPWVKTSLAPGSKAVTEYLTAAGLLGDMEALGFHVVGYGCTTCIGNSGPLPEAVSQAVKENDLVVSAVLSGNRNFEGRVHPQVKANYLASPPLVVAYALAGNVGLNLTSESLGTGKDGQPVFLKDIWPSLSEIDALVQKTAERGLFQRVYSKVLDGDKNWQEIKVNKSNLYQWQGDSTYIKKPPFFDGMTAEPKAVSDIVGARVLAVLGDSVTTDHISPAGDIAAASPAGEYLKSLGVSKTDFNSYGARRGNHEVMVRGTFANIRLKNLLLPGVEGSFSLHHPSGQKLSIYDTAMAYQKEKTPLVILAGKEYGTGSSRDWAAKGTMLLGVRAVIVESFERIHRSNLVGMGVLPLQFMTGESRTSLGLTGVETFDIKGLDRLAPGAILEVVVRDSGGAVKTFKVQVRIDTPNELEYFKHGGILQYVLRSQLKRA